MLNGLLENKKHIGDTRKPNGNYSDFSSLDFQIWGVGLHNWDRLGIRIVDIWSPTPQSLNSSCNPNNLLFYGLYLLIKGYFLLSCRLLEPQVNPQRLWSPKQHVPFFLTACISSPSSCMPAHLGSFRDNGSVLCLRV